MMHLTRQTLFLQPEIPEMGYTHVVIGGGLVLTCCGTFHRHVNADGTLEKCERAEDWTIVRNPVAQSA